jgi:uncharacterized SAM-binding protein YcdF (DUF218 family)
MLLHHTLEKADIILTLGSHDIRVAEYSAKLWLDGWAPLLVCSGSGTVHRDNPAWGNFIGTTEAEAFAEVAIKMGVPKDAILIENASQNTGQNYELTTLLLKKRGVTLNKAILVQKPYMERRTYATGKVWWPNVDLIVTSPPISLENYPDRSSSTGEHWIHAMVGDLQRIKVYPTKGFQIYQEIPEEVWNAYEYLVDLGYTKSLIEA